MVATASTTLPPTSGYSRQPRIPPSAVTLQRLLVPSLETSHGSSRGASLISAFESSVVAAGIELATTSRDRSWLVRAQDKVSRLTREPTRVHPTHAVVQSVKDVLTLLHLIDLKPSRIVATAEGGISLWFSQQRYKAVIEVSNDSPDRAVIAEMPEGTQARVSEVRLTEKEYYNALKRVIVATRV